MCRKQPGHNVPDQFQFIFINIHVSVSTVCVYMHCEIQNHAAIMGNEKQTMKRTSKRLLHEISSKFQLSRDQPNALPMRLTGNI